MAWLPPPAEPIGRPPVPFSVRFRRAPVTFGMMGVTGVIFLLQMLAESVFGYDLVLALGAKANELILAGQVWRLVTPVFIHAGLTHIFVNMYSLFALGPPVERFFGAPRILAVYLLSGISGVAFSLAFNSYPSVGASGAIFGLLGALATFLYLHRGLFGASGGMQLRQLMLVGGLNLLLSLSPGIDLWGHVGGLAAGVACTLLFGPRLVPALAGGIPTSFADSRPWPEAAPGVVLAAIGVGAAALVAMFLASG